MLSSPLRIGRQEIEKEDWYPHLVPLGKEGKPATGCSKRHCTLFIKGEPDARDFRAEITDFSSNGTYVGPDITSVERISEKQTKSIRLGDVITFGQPKRNPQHQFLHVEERDLLRNVEEPSQASHHLPITEREKLEGPERISQIKENTKGSQTPPRISTSQPSQGTMPRIPEDHPYGSLRSPQKLRTDDFIDNYGARSTDVKGNGMGGPRRVIDGRDEALPPLGYVDVDDEVISVSSSQRSTSSARHQKYISIDYETGTIHIDPAPPKDRDASRGRSRGGAGRRSNGGSRQGYLRSKSPSLHRTDEMADDRRYISPDGDGRGRYDMYMGSSRGFDAASGVYSPHHDSVANEQYLGATRIPDDQLDKHYMPLNPSGPIEPAVQNIKKFPVIPISPPSESPVFNNLAPHQFSELELALDPKSAQYLRNWDPRSGLSPHQKENIENYGNKAAQMTLIVNQMKAGVIPYEESERLLKEIVNGSNRKSTASSQRGLGDSMGATTAPLTRPPVMDDRFLQDYKYVILGEADYVGPLIDLSGDLKQKAEGIPNDIKREALAEFDGRTCRFITEVADKFEILYHELRTFIAPDHTGPRIGATAEKYFSECKLTISKNKEIMDCAFQTPLFLKIGSDVKKIREFKDAHVILNKVYNLYDFVCDDKNGLRDTRDDSHVFITQIKDDHYKILLICNVLYDLIQQISLLQQNLERLDKLLEHVATEYPQNLDEVRRSQIRLENAQMNNGELDLSGSQSWKAGPTLAEIGPKLIPKMVKFLRRKRQIGAAEEKVRSMKHLRLLPVLNVDKKDPEKFVLSFAPSETILRKSFKAWSKSLLMHIVPKYEKALQENEVKEDLISGMQAQLRKAVGDLHEFESRGDVHAMLVAERALNRELKQTNYEIRNQLHYAQEKFLTHMNVDKEKIADLLKADQLQQLTDLRVENNFLREKLNRQLGKTETSTGGKPGYQQDHQPSGYDRDGRDVGKSVSGLPVGSNFNALPNPPVIRAQGNKNRLARIPRVSKQIAMRLVLAEVSRLSNGYITMKQQVDQLKKGLAEEIENNKSNAMALHKESQANLNKDRGLMALKKILLERYGKAETDAVLHQLDINGWCDLFGNSFDQLVNPPLKEQSHKQSTPTSGMGYAYTTAPGEVNAAAINKVDNNRVSSP